MNGGKTALAGVAFVTIVALSAPCAAQECFDSHLKLDVYVPMRDGGEALLGTTPTEKGEGVRIPEGKLWFVQPVQARLSRLDTRLLLDEVAEKAIPGVSLFDRGIEPDTCARLARLTHLRYLDLGRSLQIGDGDLKRVGKLRRLETLSLAFCPLISADGLRHLQSLPALRRLDLGGTNIRAPAVDVLGDMDGLAALSLNLCSGLTEEALAGLRRMENLQWISLYDCEQISDEGVRNLAQCSGLRSVNIGGTTTGDDGVRALAELEKLRALWLNRTQISDEAVSALTCLPGLERLFLDLTIVADRSMVAVGQLRTLRELSLAGCRRISDDSLAHLSDLTQLETLVLAHLKIKGAGFRHLERLRKLRSLNLSHTRIAAEGLKYATAFKGLEELHLMATPVDNRALTYVRKFRNLKVLNLQGCKNLGPEALTALTGLPELRLLDLQGARYTEEDLAKFRARRPGVRVLE